jgi:hypothetical protein
MFVRDYPRNTPPMFAAKWLEKTKGGVGLHISVIGIRGGPCDIYHIPSENVPLKSEIFT